MLKTIKSKQELKIELIKNGITKKDFASMLGYSVQYMDQCILVQNKKEIARMLKLLKKLGEVK